MQAEELKKVFEEDDSGMLTNISAFDSDKVQISLSKQIVVKLLFLLDMKIDELRTGKFNADSNVYFEIEKLITILNKIDVFGDKAIVRYDENDSKNVKA